MSGACISFFCKDVACCRASSDRTICFVSQHGMCHFSLLCSPLLPLVCITAVFVKRESPEILPILWDANVHFCVCVHLPFRNIQGYSFSAVHTPDRLKSIESLDCFLIDDVDFAGD